VTVWSGNRTRFQRRLIAAAALLVLLVAQSPSVAGGQLAGWSATHGHVTLNGTIPPHQHPWDRPAAANASDTPAAQSEDVAFTFSDSGRVDLAFAVMLPPDGRPSLPHRDLLHLVGPMPVRTPVSAHVDVPKPRPRA